MTQWAVGEFEMLQAKYDMHFRDSLDGVISQLRSLERGKMWDDGTGKKLIQQAIETIRGSLGLPNVIVFKINQTVDG
jgi:hypothetical protein